MHRIEYVLLDMSDIQTCYDHMLFFKFNSCKLGHFSLVQLYFHITPLCHKTRNSNFSVKVWQRRHKVEFWAQQYNKSKHTFKILFATNANGQCNYHGLLPGSIIKWNTWVIQEVWLQSKRSKHTDHIDNMLILVISTQGTVYK